MKKIFYFMLALCAMLTLNSCTIENDNNTTIVFPNTYGTPTVITPGTQNANGEYAITFGSYTSGSRAMTRAAAASVSGTGYDDLNLYCWNADEVVMNGFHVQWATTNWAYAGVDNQEVKYFRNQYAEYNFIGVIPYNAEQSFSNGVLTVTGVKAFTQDNPWESTTGSGIGNNTEDTPDEFLYCTTNVPKALYSTGATLNFKHGNAKIYFKFKSDDANTEIINYKEETPGTPAIPGGQLNVSAKIIDELVAGNTVAWPYAVDANLTSTQANVFYKASSNYGQLGDLVNVVNAQFDYFDEDGNASNADWVETVSSEPNTSKKNKVQFKLNSTVDASAFAAGNDAFWTNASDELKTVFQKAYNEGWRVVRVNALTTGGYGAWLVNNTQVNYVINTPDTPAVPGTPGINGVIVLPATSTAGDGSDAVLSHYVSEATATIDMTNGLVFNATDYNNKVVYTIPNGKFNSTEVTSPTVFYSIPTETSDVGYTVKVSYIYKGVKYYDVRVYIPAAKCQWEKGKYYTYVINITGPGNGKTDEPGDENDPVVTPNNEIKVINVIISDYESGTTEIININ